MVESSLESELLFFSTHGMNNWDKSSDIDWLL